MTQTTGRSLETTQIQTPAKAVATGVSGLDEILGGGLSPNCLYLLQGSPGSGKTTLGLQFLREGVAQGERVIYVTLSESTAELESVAKSHGWTLEGMEVVELVPSDEALLADSQYTMFHASEVELGDTTKRVLEQIERVKPSRVVFDSLSEMRLLAQNPLRYRRQILSLKQYFTGRQCTVLLLDDKTSDHSDVQLQSLAHGVIDLEQNIPTYGAERRRLHITKMRGKKYAGGYHDFVIRRGGLQVFPRLIAAEHGISGERGIIESGLPQLDELLGGGLQRGTSTLIVGPTGSGKSSLSALFAIKAAERGERAAFFLFDETIATFLNRSESLGMPIRKHLQAGKISVQQIDPAEMTPGEFADRIRESAEDEHATVIIIDSLNGYLNAMPEERFLTIQLHEMLTLLSQKGVITILIAAQHGIVGYNMPGPIDASYLSDCVILLRYFEACAAVRQAISVVKKRTSAHEKTIREYKLTSDGIQIGEPLREFQSVLAGVPSFVGNGAVLSEGNDH
jgi:circadian clock protein KaiC